MASLSHRMIETMLRQLQAEKEERLKKASVEERQRLEEEEQLLQRKLLSAERKKQEFDEKVTREQEELEKLRAAVEEQAKEAAEEHRQFRLQQRIEEFRGNDTEELRERLVSEGFDPRLIDVTLRRRTLDESIARPSALQAKFSHLEDQLQPRKDSPFAAIYSGEAGLDQLNDRRVLDHIYQIRNQQESRGYLQPQDRNFLDSFSSAAERIQDQYRPEGAYFNRAATAIESIKERDEMERLKKDMGIHSTDMGEFYRDQARSTYTSSPDRPRDQH